MSYVTEYVAGPSAEILPIIGNDVIGISQSITFSISKEIGMGILGIGGTIIFSDLDRYRLPKDISKFDVFTAREIMFTAGYNQQRPYRL